MDTFIKHGSERAIAWEAAGLNWLAEAQTDGGARVARVVSAQGETLEIERIQESAPSPKLPVTLGHSLPAHTHPGQTLLVQALMAGRVPDCKAPQVTSSNYRWDTTKTGVPCGRMRASPRWCRK